MKEQQSPSFNIQIHMAGDIAAAKLRIQQHAADVGMCVTVSPQTFIYTGGCEEGFCVGFINYPRFPKPAEDIIAAARDLANILLVHLGQHSYSIVSPIDTIWVSRRDDGR